MRKWFLGAALAAIASVAFAQTAATPVVPGTFANTGCAGSASTCFIPNTSLSRARVQSLASTNSTLVLAGAVRAFNIVVGNNGAAVAYLKLYDKATAPTCGTDTPIATILLPVNGTVVVAPTFGVGVVNGLGYCITGGAADTDTTAVAANQVVGFIGYH